MGRPLLKARGAQGSEAMLVAPGEKETLQYIWRARRSLEYCASSFLSSWLVASGCVSGLMACADIFQLLQEKNRSFKGPALTKTEWK